MNRLTCIPPSHDVDRAVALVPQKYVDEMFMLAETELKCTLEVGVLGHEMYESSPPVCKWFNSEVYLAKFVKGLRGRTEQVHVGLSSTYTEALEQLPHTDQLPSWMRHGPSYKLQLYALATYDAIERLDARFEALGSGHSFVAMVQDVTSRTGRSALHHYATTSERRRSSYQAVRNNGFWPSQLISVYQAEMYDQTLRSFLSRGRFATALGDFSRNFRSTWGFIDAESIRYRAPRVLHDDQLSRALERRRLELQGNERTSNIRTPAERNLTFVEGYGGAATVLSNAARAATTSATNMSEVITRAIDDATGDWSRLSRLSPSDEPPTQEDVEAARGDESGQTRNARTASRGLAFLTTSGQHVSDRQYFDRAILNNENPMEEGTEWSDAGDSNPPPAISMPDPTPADLELRARISRLATQMNVPETEIRQTVVRWNSTDPIPDNLIGESYFDMDSQMYAAPALEVRPQRLPMPPQPGDYTYESI